MIIDVYDESDAVLYIPDYKNNRELDEAEQIVVHLIPMTQKLQTKFQNMVRFEAEGRKSKKIKSNAAEVTKATLVHCINKIENLKGRKPNGALIDITNGALLYDFADPELIEDILAAIQKRTVMEEGLKKA